MKLLTISIAAYNVEKYLEKTLSSLVVSGSVREYLEVIIVNDGSKDDTKKIAEKYTSAYPDVFKLIDKPNGGYGSTINASIPVAAGTYFKQLDGDDWVETENLESFILFLKKVNSDLVVIPFIKCYETGKNEDADSVPFLENEKEESVSILNQAHSLAMHELAIKTKLLRDNNIRIIENCFYTDNEYTFYPLLYAKTVIKFNHPIYCYRLGRTGQSVSIEGVRKHYKDMAKVANALYSKWASNSHPSCHSLLECALKGVTDSTFTFYLIAGGKEDKKELMAFDKSLKTRYREIYKLTYKTRKIKLLRLSHFVLFNFARRIVLSRREDSDLAC